MYQIASSLRLFVPNSLQAYHHFFFPKGFACAICDRSRLPSPWLGSHGDYSATAFSTPSLRSLILSGSLIRCELVKVYHCHLALVGAGKSSEWPVLLHPQPRAPCTVSFFVLERADSTMPSHSLPVTWWKSWLLASLPVTWWKSRLLVSWPPVQKSAWCSCRMPSNFLDVAAVSGLSPLCHCCV
jgi:hypothetical protein